MSEAASRPSALVVDDDPGVRALLTEVLRLRAWRVVTAADGRAGLACALAETFDVIFVDLHMPGLNGLEVAMALHRRGFCTPVFLITGDTGFVDAARARGAGIRQILEKPFRYQQIVACLEALPPCERGRKGIDA